MGGRPTIDEFERTSPTAATKKGNLHNHAGSGRFHNGGSIYFNPKDAAPNLYLSVGDAENPGGAASPEGTNGRILKIDVATKMVSTRHFNIRNPYRMSIDRATGDMWIGNVAGPQGGEVYFAANDKAPTNWGHDATNNSITGRDSSGNALIGGVVYRGSKIPALCGRYFYGQHNSGLVKSLIHTNGTRTGDPTTHGTLQSSNLSSFGEDGEGEIYISTLGGAVFKVEAQ
jgi:glucose/arabinose dehydrogenase